jgi:hypothetical protein
MRLLLLPAIAALALGVASAAQPEPEALEPAVDTSAPATPAPRVAAPPADKPAPPAVSRPATTSPAAAPRPNAPATGGRARDRVDLEATQITGNRELPRVMYVVPWKKSDLGDLGGRPVNSLLDEVLTPVDRGVFQRQNRYYDALKPDARPPGDAAPAN